MKKRKKLKQWLIGALSFVIVIITSVYIVINYTVDKLIKELADSAIQSSEQIEADLTFTHEGNHSATNSTSSTQEVPAASASKEKNSPKSLTENNRSAETKPEVTIHPIKSKNDNDAPIETTNNSPQSNSKYEYEPDVSQEKAETVKEDISFSEKTKLMTIMLKRLDASDIKTLSQLASGGLSGEKKVEAKKIILQKLTEEEYDDLIKIAKKYGLSEGKSYEDSIKDPGMQSENP
ncbi:hypothetical protein ACFSR7_19580 [Cohnella sp. GCM10020058]|uniref:hypothetical protein n=1 Tax=Cohnella sp. GCM10020058 TaxID=3317330 RepID=UPI0036323B17